MRPKYQKIINQNQLEVNKCIERTFLRPSEIGTLYNLRKVNGQYLAENK